MNTNFWDRIIFVIVYETTLKGVAMHASSSKRVVSEKKWEKPLIRINITCAPVVKITFHICVNLNQMKQIRFFRLSIITLYTNCIASLSSVTRRRSSSIQIHFSQNLMNTFDKLFLLFSNIYTACTTPNNASIYHLCISLYSLSLSLGTLLLS